MVNVAQYIDGYYPELGNEWLAYPNPSLTAIAEAVWSHREDRNIYVFTLKVDGVVDSSVTIDLRNYSSAWTMMNRLQQEWYNSGSLKDELAQKYNNGQTLSLVVRKPISNTDTVKRLNQVYRDGDYNHCIQKPVLKWAEGLVDNAKTKRKKRENGNIVDRIKSLMDGKYKDGVPETELQNYVDELNITIKIYNILGDLDVMFKTKGKCLKTFEYTNVRENHVELKLDYLFYEDDTKELSYEEMKKMYKSIKNPIHMFGKEKKKPFFMVNDLSTDVPNVVRTEKQSYKMIDDYQQVFADFNKHIGLTHGNYSLDVIKEPEHCHFIEQGFNNFTHFKPPNLDQLEPYYTENPDYSDLHEQDMEKAFSHFNECTYYEGIPGNFTNQRIFTEQPENVWNFLKDQIGYYKVKIIKTNPFFKLFMLEDEQEYVLCSPMLLFLMDNKIEFELIYGLWGKKMPDFDFRKYDEQSKFDLKMVGGKSRKNINMYAHWVGTMNQKKTSKSFCFPATKAFHDHIKSTIPKESTSEIRYFAPVEKEQEMVMISHRKKSCQYHPQIYGFITSYTAITVMEEMLKFDPKKLAGVKVDSILFLGINKITNPLFREKEPKIGFNWGHEWFRPCDDYKYTIFHPRRIDGMDLSLPVPCFGAGGGGHGKSHSVVGDKGFRNMLFVSPTLKLCAEMRDKFSEKVGDKIVKTLHTCSLNKFMGFNCVKRCDEWGMNPVMVFDETTMYDHEVIANIIGEYQDHVQLIFLGDIDRNGIYHQLPPVTFTNPQRGMTKDEFENHMFHIVDFPIDYRAKCPKLKELKLLLRQTLVEVQDMAYKTQWTKIKDVLLIYLMENNIQLINVNTLKSHYKTGDRYIAYTNKQCDDMTNDTKDIGLSYLVTGKTKDHFRGEILDKSIGIHCKPRNGFTVHSFQGSTIQMPRQEFINISWMPEPTMLFTAISRAEYLSQIVFCYQSTQEDCDYCEDMMDCEYE